MILNFKSHLNHLESLQSHPLFMAPELKKGEFSDCRGSRATHVTGSVQVGHRRQREDIPRQPVHPGQEGRGAGATDPDIGASGRAFDRKSLPVPDRGRRGGGAADQGGVHDQFGRKQGVSEQLLFPTVLQKVHLRARRALFLQRATGGRLRTGVVLERLFAAKSVVSEDASDRRLRLFSAGVSLQSRHFFRRAGRRARPQAHFGGLVLCHFGLCGRHSPGQRGAKTRHRAVPHHIPAATVCSLFYSDSRHHSEHAEKPDANQEERTWT